MVLGSFDGGQVAEDDGALLVTLDRWILQHGKQGVPGLGQVCPALSCVLPLKAASRMGVNQVNQSGEACWLPAARIDSACPISRRASRVCPLIVSHSASTASSQARNSAEAAPSGTWRARERR